MVQDTLMLVTAIRILSLLVRGFACSTNRETLVRKKKALSALIPAIAGLATIAVEQFELLPSKKKK